MSRNGIEPVEAAVTWLGDVPRAGDAGRRFAVSLGFPDTHCAEIALAVTELASNLIRHASGGMISMGLVREGEQTGIEIRSVDNGPGISDPEQAITDGYSTAGGPGFGLGTVNRLMDELEIYPGPEGGLHIICRRWARTQSAGPDPGVLAFGAATRSRRNLPENGDAFIFKRWDGKALAGVIDGLGHGPFAQRASQAARQYIENHFDQPLENIFRGAGRACRATRGVVMALACFDLARRTLTLAGVGNISVRLAGGTQRCHLLPRRGIVGLNAPDAFPAEFPWTPRSILIMHSDGVKPNWELSEFGHLMQETPPTTVAWQLLSKLGRADDDGTIIVVRSAE